jgi:hypothetical protein
VNESKCAGFPAHLLFIHQRFRPTIVIGNAFRKPTRDKIKHGMITTRKPCPSIKSVTIS